MWAALCTVMKLSLHDILFSCFAKTELNILNCYRLCSLAVGVNAVASNTDIETCYTE